MTMNVVIAIRFPAARHGFVQGLVHDPGIEAEGVLVEAATLENGGGLPVP